MAGKKSENEAPEQPNKELPSEVEVHEPTAAELHAAKMREIDAEIRLVELETKKIQLEQAKRSNLEFTETEEERKAAAAQAQRILRAGQRTKRDTVAACSHMTGGIGKEDIYEGDGKPSLIRSELPIQGRALIVCFRCMGEWYTPDVNVKKTDPETYADQLSDWLTILKLEKQALSTPMGGPSFAFTTDEGIPAMPPLR